MIIIVCLPLIFVLYSIIFKNLFKSLFQKSNPNFILYIFLFPNTIIHFLSNLISTQIFLLYGITSFCGVVFFTSPFHLGGRHAKPFTRNLEGECVRGGMNFVSVLPTISHELSYLSYE